MSPFDIRALGTTELPKAMEAPVTGVCSEGRKTGSNGGGGEIVLFEESKKTAQRKVQRQRKAAFKEKSQQWPMTIECTPEGEIPKDVRVFVHAQFRATSRKFLRLSVIHFRDHPDSDIKVVMEDLERRF